MLAPRVSSKARSTASPRRALALLGALLGGLTAVPAAATPADPLAPPAAPALAPGVPEPTGPHPRMLLDGALRAAWRAEAAASRGPVARAIAVCRDAGTTTLYEREGYQGSDWAKALQSCLVAWIATDAAEHAATALRYLAALLDDLEVVGDGKGGDTSAQRDDGYAIRNLGPFTALAYDWLYDAPGMTPALRARARSRWGAWLTWYALHGYRARNPGTNYQAGYLVAATLIAVAQGGEAGPAGTWLWRLVADELWGKDMATALGGGGLLEGGDWPEGWQYGPLAVGNYALAARVARGAGIEVVGIEGWLSSVLRRHVHGLSPSDGVYAAGDTQFATPTLRPRELVLTAVALGDAPAQDRRWARAERERLGLADDDALLFDALGVIGEPGEPIPRAGWPTWYRARGAGTFYARTRWDDRAVWFVAECRQGLRVDHHTPNAGTFVLSRGRDDVIVDPSPYGSLSTLTTNAPTVASTSVSPEVTPSQDRYGKQTGWAWATQRSSGVIAARCDYADQYRQRAAASDVPEAARDLILLPSLDGLDATLVVVDRATTGSAERGLYLRFRVPGSALALAGDAATATVGTTRLAITSSARTGGQPRLAASVGATCDGAPRGRCEAARFPVTDYRLEVPGPGPRAVHALSVTGAPAPAPTALAGAGWAGVRVAGPGDAVVVWPVAPGRPGAPLLYRAPRGAAVTHVVLDAPSAGGVTRLATQPAGDDCELALAADDRARPGAREVRVGDGPLILSLDGDCTVTDDPERTDGTLPRPPPGPPGGGRGAKVVGAAVLGLGVIATLGTVLIVLLRRRRRQRRRTA